MPPENARDLSFRGDLRTSLHRYEPCMTLCPATELKQRASSPRVSAKDETGRPRACEEKRKTCELQSARANVQWSVADHAHVKSNLSLS